MTYIPKYRGIEILWLSPDSDTESLVDLRLGDLEFQKQYMYIVIRFVNFFYMVS